MSVARDDGYVAIRYVQEVPHLIQVHGNEYLFQVRNHVNITWVRPEDVDATMAIKGGCNCPGNYNRQKYIFASEKDVEIWNR